MTGRAFVEVGGWQVDVAEIVAWRVSQQEGSRDGELKVVTKNDLTFTGRGEPRALVEHIESALNPPRREPPPPIDGVPQPSLPDPFRATPPRRTRQ